MREDELEMLLNELSEIGCTTSHTWTANGELHLTLEHPLCGIYESVNGRDETIAEIRDYILSTKWIDDIGSFRGEVENAEEVRSIRVRAFVDSLNDLEFRAECEAARTAGRLNSHEYRWLLEVGPASPATDYLPG